MSSCEGNRKSGVTLATRHRHSGSLPTGSRPRRGRWAPSGVWWTLPYLYLATCSLYKPHVGSWR